MPTIIRISPPAERIETPVPPQGIGERGECIGIEAICVNIPVPCVQSIDNIEINGAADADGIAGIAEADDAGGILVVVGRTVELSSYPFAFQSVILPFINVKSVILSRKFIVGRIITTVVLVYITCVALSVTHYNSSGTVVAMNTHRRV